MKKFRKIPLYVRLTFFHECAGIWAQCNPIPIDQPLVTYVQRRPLWVPLLAFSTSPEHLREAKEGQDKSRLSLLLIARRIVATGNCYDRT